MHTLIIELLLSVCVYLFNSASDHLLEAQYLGVHFHHDAIANCPIMMATTAFTSSSVVYWTQIKSTNFPSPPGVCSIHVRNTRENDCIR